MQQPTLQEHLSAFRQWHTRVARGLKDLDGWLTDNYRATDESRACIDAALAALPSERLAIAFLAEAEGSKSSLINALFLHDIEGNLIPGYSDRNNTCPMELYWDEELEQASLHLLPIETLRLGLPLSRLLAAETRWVHRPLDVRDPVQTAIQMHEVTLTRKLAPAEAQALGLASPVGPNIGQIEGPRWRYAVANLPCPSWRLDLRVLNIPVPMTAEITSDILAQAQVVVCVLAVDQNLDGGKIEQWRQRFRALGNAGRSGIVVALNKVDRLWVQNDDVGGAERIERCRTATASALGLELEQVFPVSATQAMAARDRGDQGLLHRTGIEALGADIGTRLLSAGTRAHRANLDAGLGKILEHNRAHLNVRIQRAKTNLTKIEDYLEKCDDRIDLMLDKTRHAQELHLRGVQRLRTSRRSLIDQTKHCRDILDRNYIEALIAQADANMLHSWTTAGVTVAMKGLFDELRHAMQTIATESKRIRKLVRETYEAFQHNFDCELTAPKVFVPTKFRIEIELIQGEVEAFRRNPRLALVEHGVVVKRFHDELVSRAKVVFDQLRAAFDTWLRDALRPLAEYIREHELGLARRREQLQRLGRSKDDATRHLDAANVKYAGLARRLTDLRNISNSLRQTPFPELGAGTPPRAATQSA